MRLEMGMNDGPEIRTVQEKTKVLFEKFHGPSCKEDWVRVSTLSRAATQAKGFLAPAPIVMSVDKETIAYELLPEGRLLATHCLLQMLRTSREHPNRLLGIFHRVGCGLAQFHRFFELPAGEVVSLDLDSVGGLNRSVRRHVYENIRTSRIAGLHGDFGTGNVWIRDGDEAPIILDPIPSRFCPNPRGTRASIYYDIGHMVSTIWCVYPVWIYPLLSFRHTPIFVDAFLRGYETENQSGLDRDTVRVVALFLIDAYTKTLRRDSTRFVRPLHTRFIKTRRSALVRELEG